MNARPSFVLPIFQEGPGGAERLLGTGIVVAPNRVLTCRHVVHKRDAQGDISDTPVRKIRTRIGEGGEGIACKVVDFDRDRDLALLETKTHLEREPLGFLEGVTGEHVAPFRQLSWYVFGFAAEGTRADLRCYLITPLLHGVSVDTDFLSDLQAEGGLAEGVSGGPLLLQMPDETWAGLGVVYLGGRRAATSRIIPADVLLKFLGGSGVAARAIPAPPPQSLPRIELQLLKALTGGFLGIVEKLSDQEVDSVAQQKTSRIKEWLRLPDTRARSERVLQDAIARSIEEVRGTAGDEPAKQLFRYLNDSKSNSAIPQLIAATAIAMPRYNPRLVPPYLMRQMGVGDAHRDQLATFLYSLRKNLGGAQGYGEAISYADDLDGLGLLEEFAEGVAASVDHLADFLKVEFRSRRLTTDQKKALEDYLRTLRIQQLTFSTLPLAKASTQKLTDARIKEIFVPIPLRKKDAEKKAEPSRRHPPSEEASATRDTAELGEVLLSRRKVVVLGPPGGGKSTLLRKVALAFAEARVEDVPGWSSTAGAIPIFLRLRSFAFYLQSQGSRFLNPSHGSVLAYLEHHYREEHRIQLTPDFFDRLLDGGGCAVFMDGLDEVAVQTRNEVAQHVAAFISRYERINKEPDRGGEAARHELSQANRERIQENFFALASRPKGYETVEVYLRQADFVVCEVKPLEPAGIRRLVTNLLKVIESSPEKRKHDYKGLNEAIFASRDLTIMAGNPLFCTSLVLVYKCHGAQLPRRRVDVFQENVDLLLGFWKVQDDNLCQAGQLEQDDGTGTVYTDLKTAVRNKKKRLSHIAFQMQLTGKRTSIDFPTLVDVLSTYLIETEQIPPERARAGAERFLLNSHERSGLLVEMEPTDPPVYGFTHEGFREYLVANAITAQRESKIVASVLEHIDDPTWEEIILLAGAHPGLNDEVREYLLDECINAARAARAEVNPEVWVRRLGVTGRMSRDMGDLLSPPNRTKVKRILLESALDTANHIKHRIDLALLLDDLGWLSDTLWACAEVPAPGGVFRVGKHLVSNQQYQRFVEADDFADEALWQEAACVDCNGLPYSVRDESLLWVRLHEGDRRYPGYWNDPNFGIAHRGLPVVGVSWFEANAYCNWLLKHWDELEEATVNSKVKPKLIRLPTEREWSLAVAAEGQRRYPWESPDGPGGEPVDDLSRFANVGGLSDRTTPVGMFPEGASVPHGIMDACGNAWEWQANFFDRGKRAVALRGGSFMTSGDDASACLRGNHEPAGRDSEIGFRILVET